MDISDIQSHARELRTVQGWADVTPELRLAYVVTEVGEVARELVEMNGTQSELSAEAKERLGMEIYDVFWNLCDLANTLGVDLESAFSKKAELNRRRQW